MKKEYAASAEILYSISSVHTVSMEYIMHAFYCVLSVKS